MGWVDEDDLVELVTPILTDPVGVQDLEVRVATADALLRDLWMLFAIAIFETPALEGFRFMWTFPSSIHLVGLGFDRR